MILLIDNYDSFTFNLVHYLQELGAEVRVERNDALTAREAVGSGAKGILLSPGPRTPNEAGITLDTVAACADAGLPLLGVCLGHQAIGQHFGGIQRCIGQDRRKFLAAIAGHQIGRAPGMALDFGGDGFPRQSPVARFV